MIIKYMYRSLFIALLLALPMSAFAKAKSGSYLGFSAGNAEQADDDDRVNLDNESEAVKMYFGYTFNTQEKYDLSIETSFVNLGEMDSIVAGVNTPSEIDGLASEFVLGYSWGAFGVFTKTGVFQWESKVRSDGRKLDDSGLGATAGLGVRYLVSSGLALRAELEFYGVDEAEFGVATAGLTLRF